MVQNMVAYYAIKAMAHYEKETLVKRLSYLLSDDQLKALTIGFATKIELTDVPKFQEYVEKRFGIAKANIESATFDGVSVDCRIPRDIVMQVSGIDKTGEEVYKSFSIPIDANTITMFDRGLI